MGPLSLFNRVCLHEDLLCPPSHMYTAVLSEYAFLMVIPVLGDCTERHYRGEAALSACAVLVMMLPYGLAMCVSCVFKDALPL